MMKVRLLRMASALLLIVCVGSFLFGCHRDDYPQGNPSAYELAVNKKYTGTTEEFFTALAQETLGYGSAYEAAQEKGYSGTANEWLTPLVGQTIENVEEGATAYEVAVANGYTGSSEEWLNSLAQDEDGIQIKLNPLRPSFAWIDDDGKSKVEYLYDWAVENQVPFTSALISGYIDTKNGWLTSDRVLEMYETGLVTFGSHTQNHVKLGEAAIDVVEAELANSKAQIESFGVPCEVMVYPYGSITDDGIATVQEYYPYAFLAGGKCNSDNIPTADRVNYSPISTYRLTRVDIRGDFTEENGGIDYVKNQIDDAIANNGMLVFMSHIGSTDDGNGGYLDPSADLAVYTQIVNYIREKGYDIEPVSTVCERFANVVEVGNWSGDNADGYFVIGADGRVEVDDMNGQVVAENNEYTNATLPSQYPQNQVTTCYITGGTAGAGLPGATRGILTAYLVDRGGYRTFMPSTSSDLYVQIRSSSKDEWKNWVKVNENVYSILNNNRINHATKPSAIPSGISVCIVTNSAALNALPGDGGMGYLTTYRISSNAANIRQEWQPFNSLTTYVRLADTAGEWGPWYKLEPVPVE